MRHLLFGLLALVVGCVSMGSTSQPQRVTRYLPKQSEGCIFVANGSGDSGSLTQNLSKALQASEANLQLETFDWSHGAGQSIIDHIDRENHDYQAKRLSEQLIRYSAASGNNKIYLAAHSTGCEIILSAMKHLPPGSVEKIALLSPSVPDTYDLRPALTASRQGIDSYNSVNDTFILGLGMAVISTTDPSSRTAAGINGFRIPQSTATDAMLYQKLRQHPWNAAAEKVGNNGGHYGSITVGFLRTFVLPNLLTR